MRSASITAASLLALLLSGCAAGDSAAPQTAAKPNVQDQFFEKLGRLCGQAFAGRLTSDAAQDSDMAGKEMVMHIRRCTPDRIEIPFHISGASGGDGWDRSRTWIITRTATGLRLKHDHRRADGTPDPVTLYGGDTAELGSADHQTFPVDAESIAMFKANGLDASVTNIWTITVSEHDYVYGLKRADRDFRVRFDFSQPVSTPPTPWGW